MRYVDEHPPRNADDGADDGCPLGFHAFTFTTLGYGGIVLPDRWRLLASFEAANGIIVFGWITAMVMAVVQRAFATLLEHGQRNKESSD